MLQAIAAYVSMSCFTILTIGVLIGFCGPMGSPLTTFCRKRFLSLPRRRTVEIWENFVMPLVMLYASSAAFEFHLPVAGLFLLFTTVLWMMRNWLLDQHPHRGWQYVGFDFVRENGRTRVIFKR